jgi:hypothetical protein
MDLAARILDKLRQSPFSVEELCSFGEPPHFIKKRARLKDLPYQSRFVIMVGRSICSVQGVPAQGRR